MGRIFGSNVNDHLVYELSGPNWQMLAGTAMAKARSEVSGSRSKLIGKRTARARAGYSQSRRAWGVLLWTSPA